MNILFKVLSAFLFLLFMIAQGGRSQELQELPPKKKILVLHGSAEAGRWDNQFNASFYDQILKNGRDSTGVSHEFLALGYIPGGVSPEKIISYLQYKTRLNPVDLVIGVLPKANKFLFTYGAEIFPGIPKIYVIPSAPLVTKIQSAPDTVVIPSASETALKTSIERIFSILPDTENLVVVSGVDYMDLFYLSTVKKTIVSFGSKVQSSYLVHLIESSYS